MEYEAIVFDNDGVLVTPTDPEALRSAARAAFADAGVDDPDPAHVEELTAGVDPAWFERVCAEYGVDAGTFWRYRDERASLAQREEIRAGRKRLYEDVDAIRDLPHDLGIVSTNQHVTIEFIVEHFGLAECFSTYYGREPTVDSLRRKKPHPHYLRAALADLDADDALYVGDSESDVEAARNAGIDSAFVRRPHRDGYELSTDPTHVIDSLDRIPDLVRADPGR